MKKTHINGPKIIYWLFVSLVVLELLGAVISIIFSTSSASTDAAISNIFLSLLAIILFTIPWVIESRFKVDIPNYIEILILCFVFASIVLGNIHGWLVSVKNYDKLLHTVSGVTISIMAFDGIHLYNKNKKSKNNSKMSAGVVAIFAFTIAMTLLVLWEFYEFSVDTISYLFNHETLRNMQRYQWDNTSTIFPQDYGLLDTMLDLIVGCIGAAFVSVIGWRILRKGEKQESNEDN